MKMEDTIKLTKADIDQLVRTGYLKILGEKTLEYINLEEEDDEQ